MFVGVYWGAPASARPARFPVCWRVTIPSCTPSPDRNAEKLKAYAAPFKPQKTYTDYQALLDDENVDAVYLPLPNGVHKEWVLKAGRGR